MGGDEFLLVFRDIIEEELEDVWKRISDDLEGKYVKDIQVSASHGITIITPELETTLDQAINEADEAMYREKKQHYLSRT